MKRSAIVIASVLALAGVSAQAYTYDWTDLSSPLVIDQSYGLKGATFSDTINFTLASASDLSVTVGSLLSATSGVSNATFSFYQGGALQESFSISGTSLVLPYSSLAAGNYSFVIAGTVSGAKGEYTLNASVAAVPEPETYALMLAGLGAVGFMARRRKSA